MKKSIIAILFIASMLLMSCTENARTRTFGGTQTVDLPKGQRLITATWKEADIWYLTEPMPEGYQPTPKTFNSKTSFGIAEGKVIFYESR
jgi:hypothetical protein